MNFLIRKIYATGDMNNRLAFVGSMDEIEDKEFNDALVIICDVAVKKI
ncbi:MAG: hypothetical protein L6U99_07425 [Clostridium sp.]|nr:MAG: hypothetical protein L6U99_07425 [Clostridium sp.]